MSAQSNPSHDSHLQRLQQTLAELKQKRYRIATDILQHTTSGNTSLPSDHSTLYSLWRIEYHGVRNHIALFLENESDGNGIEYHVTGTVPYQRQREENLENGVEYVADSRKLLGSIQKDDVARLDAICEANPAPAKQGNLEGAQSGLTDPLRRCGVWIDEVIEQLRDQGILVDVTAIETPEEAAQVKAALKVSNEVLQEHIRLLRRYNETKDVATTLIGMIAESRQERIVDVIKSFDAEVED